MKRLTTIIMAAIAVVSCGTGGEQVANSYDGSSFPYTVTDQTPQRANLSLAIQRAFNDYPSYRPEDNPLYTSFKYSPFKGFDYRGGDGTVSRRDPSKIIRVGDKYYMWYTKRDTKCAPIGASNADKVDDETPSTDWDLSEIWYATSSDGFTWEEQAAAVPLATKPEVGHRSVSTPDILVWKGKYYLYYQAFTEPSGLKGDYCPVSMSYAETPDGPWTHTRREIIPLGEEGAWDQFAVHDPYPLVHNGKIYIYYKSAFNRPDKLWVSAGVVTADDPAGPFVRSVRNPLFNGGHETALFPFKEGVAAMIIQDGTERNTVQYAEDWENFSIASLVATPPTAAGAYVPDAFTDTKDGQGIQWGACHFIGQGKGSNRYSVLERFDCNLTQYDMGAEFKSTKVPANREVYMKQNPLSKSIENSRMKQYTLE